MAGLFRSGRGTVQRLCTNEFCGFHRIFVDAILRGNEQDLRNRSCRLCHFVHYRYFYFSSRRHSADGTTRTAVAMSHPRDVLVQCADRCLPSSGFCRYRVDKQRCTKSATSMCC